MGRINSTEARANLAYGPGHSAFAITPHATNHLQQNSEDVVVRAIYVGVSGDITGKVLTESGAAATIAFLAVPVGVLNVAFFEIHITGTTATDMVGLL